MFHRVRVRIEWLIFACVAYIVVVHAKPLGQRLHTVSAV